MYLLQHIIRLVVEPHSNQHPDIRRLSMNVAKLEEATFDALSGFFADTENANNTQRMPYLKEIFYLARNEEKYKNGEIGK